MKQCALCPPAETNQSPSPNSSILDEAKRLVHGDRGASYGHPLDDFARTAAMWRQRLRCEVTPEDVAWCMAAVKLSRLCQSPGHRDSVVDTAGYMETYQMCIDERVRRETAKSD